MRETIEQYLERKKAKGTLGQKKVGKRRLTRGGPVVDVYTGWCPCLTCKHEVMLECDPDYADCHCCEEVCS